MRVTSPEHLFNHSRFLGKRRPGPREDIQPVFGSDANVLATTISKGTQGHSIKSQTLTTLYQIPSPLNTSNPNPQPNPIKKINSNSSQKEFSEMLPPYSPTLSNFLFPSRHARLQYFTSSQFFSHFFRQENGRKQTTHVFSGKFLFLCI
jgi:hypothetical protein